MQDDARTPTPMAGLASSVSSGDAVRKAQVLSFMEVLAADLFAEAIREPGLAARRMLQVEKATHLLRELYMLFAGPVPNPEGRRRRGSPGVVYAQGGISAQDYYDDSESDSLGGIPSSGNLLTGQMAETFGAKTLQELIAAIPSLILMHSMPRRIESIAELRKSGAEGSALADELEDRLRVDLGLASREKASAGGTSPVESEAG